MDIENEATLVLTASIDPKGMSSAASVADPRQREGDYFHALEYYLQSHPRIRRIVFAENSGWPLDRFGPLAQQHAGRTEIEFLSFSLNDFPRHLGKSYGEMLLLDNVFEKSRLIAASTYVAKITGRICLLNLTRLLQSVRTPLDFADDLRDHRIYDILGIHRSGHHGDARFFITTPSFYQRNLLGKYHTLDDSRGVVVETLIYNAVKENLRSSRVIGRFRIEPQFHGVAGHWGKNYGGSREKLKRSLRQSLRLIAPWLWV